MSNGGIRFFLIVIGISGICSYSKAAELNVPAQYSTIQAAINAAVNGDIVRIAPGTYQGSGNKEIDFNGKHITVKSQNGYEVTIIDCQGSGRGFYFHSSETKDCVLDGLTITNGNVGTANGGGIRCDGSSAPAIKNCIILNNTAKFGGGLYSSSGSLELINCRFMENAATSYGGGWFASGGDSLIVGCVFQGNSAKCGGGMEYGDGNPHLIDCVFRGNSAYSAGGGFYTYFGSPVLVNCGFYGNSGSSGAGASNSQSTPSFVNCIFVGNLGIGFCGGNPADTLINCIFWNNSGYGVFAGLKTTLTNCILWGNRGSSGTIAEQQIYRYEGTSAYPSYCCIEGWPGGLLGHGNIGDNPLFMREPNDGGDDWGIGDNDDYGDLSLQPGSPCIDAGYNAGIPRDITDIDHDGNATEQVPVDFAYNQRFFDALHTPDTGLRVSPVVDIGAYEYMETCPVANAGNDQTAGSIPALVTLDGSGSYDPSGKPLNYHWQQNEGPAVSLSDPNIVNPEFIPVESGVYVFELVVDNGLEGSLPDIVGIVIGNNHLPVAMITNVISPVYIGNESIIFDGRKSFDSDGYGKLTYNWTVKSGQQIQVTIKDANTPVPEFTFSQNSSIQYCQVELVVSDGNMNSVPVVVDIVIVPRFNASSLISENKSWFNPDKPTIVFFGGGNCTSGGTSSSGLKSKWLDYVNILNFESYTTPYERCGDMLIVYLYKWAHSYSQPIQTVGFSTGGKPAIDVAKYLNMTYNDPRYAVNRVSLVDAVCSNLSSQVVTYLDNPVDDEQCWVDNFYRSAAFIQRALNVYIPDTTHDGVMAWFVQSIPSFIPRAIQWKAPFYNGGIAGGGYLSVAGPGKNLQLATADTKYAYKWVGNISLVLGIYTGEGYLDFYNQSSYPGRLPEPVTLLGPANGDTVDANGAVLTCEPSENSVGYQLLIGSDPYNMDYLISDTNQPPTHRIKTFPFENTYWTIKAIDQYGSTIYADPILIKAENIAKPIINPTGKGYLTCTGYNLLWQRRLSRTEFEYCFKMKLKNIGYYDANNKTIELKSASEDIQTLNNKVFLKSIPAQQEVLSEDTFIVKVNRLSAIDTNDIIWKISEQMEGDFSGDGKIDIVDLGLLAGNWLQTGSDMPQDLYNDQIINFRDFAIFAEHWLKN